MPKTGVHVIVARAKIGFYRLEFAIKPASRQLPRFRPRQTSRNYTDALKPDLKYPPAIKFLSRILIRQTPATWNPPIVLSVDSKTQKTGPVPPSLVRTVSDKLVLCQFKSA